MENQRFSELKLFCPQIIGFILHDFFFNEKDILGKQILTSQFVGFFVSVFLVFKVNFFS